MGLSVLMTIVGQGCQCKGDGICGVTMFVWGRKLGFWVVLGLQDGLDAVNGGRKRWCRVGLCI